MPCINIRFSELPLILPSSISLVMKEIARISRISEELKLVTLMPLNGCASPRARPGRRRHALLERMVDQFIPDALPAPMVRAARAHHRLCQFREIYLSRDKISAESDTSGAGQDFWLQYGEIGKPLDPSGQRFSSVKRQKPEADEQDADHVALASSERFSRLQFAFTTEDGQG